MVFVRQNQYSRISAVKYANEYALHPNPAFRYFPVINDTSGDCTNFLSQCLLAGNCPMIFNNTNPWWFKNSSWSDSWTIAHSLYWLLKINYEKKHYGVKGIEVNSEKDLELGDFVFLENYRGVVFHGAIVTSFLGSEPLISQHSFEALNIPIKKSWDSKIKHYLKISL